MSESFKQFSLTRISNTHGRVTFNHPLINLFDDNTIPELEHLLDLAEGEPKLKVIVFDSARFLHCSLQSRCRQQEPRYAQAERTLFLDRHRRLIDSL
jgi:hypothetical protein